MLPFKPAKWHLGLIVLLVIILLAIVGDPPTPLPVEGFFVGKLADGRAVIFSIAPSAESGATNIDCTIHVEGTGYFSTMTGVRQGSNGIAFMDSLDSERRDLARGLTGTISTKPTGFTGRLFLSDATNGLALVATNIARLETIHRHRGIKIFHYGGGTKYRATFPRFQKTNAFFAGVSAVLAADATTNTVDFVSDGYSNAWEALKERDGGPAWDWEGSEDISLACYSTRALSFYVTTYGFTGGAHGNSQVDTYNFIEADGQPRQFKFSDLFQDPTNAEPILCSICARELKLEGASSFSGDTTNTLDLPAISNFTFDGSGLAIHFAPYEVGSYAEGFYDVFIAWPEVRPLLDPKGPARLIPGALK